ncbi:MAG: PKD domain-containing protein [Deferrisomatales bacterium]|nr:PKD domain-containing protein [Deferrisomatales bacterium]
MRTLLRPLPLSLRLTLLATLLALFVAPSLMASVTVEETQVSMTLSAEYNATGNGTDTYFTLRSSDLDIVSVDALGNVNTVVGGLGDQYDQDIDGDHLVLTNFSDGIRDVAIKDLQTGAIRFIAPSPYDEFDPAISGDNVVLTSNRSGNLDIIHYSISTGTWSLFTESPISERSPAIDGELVAWYAIENGVGNVYAKTLDGQTYDVATTAKNESFPSVSGNLIAYIGDGDVYVYDVSTGQTSQVTADGATQSNVIVEGSWVYYNDNRYGNLDIFAYDLATKNEYQLTQLPTDQVLTDVDNGRVLFHDNRYGNLDVFSLTFAVNNAPVADAGADQNVRVGELVQLSGSGSDSDGDTIVAYTWIVDFAPAGSLVFLSDPGAPNPTFVPEAAGEYVFSLIVDDGTELSAPDTVTITVSGDAVPSAVALADPTKGEAPLLVSFDGSASSDAEGDLTYVWDFGDGSTSPLVSPSHTYTAAGDYLATLTVTDSAGQSDSETVLISVLSPANRAPSASPTASPSSGIAPLLVQFAANASDADGDLLTYAWDFGDGTQSDEVDPVHTFALAGTYTVSLVVSDGLDSFATSLVVVAQDDVVSTLAVSSAVIQWEASNDTQASVRVEGSFGLPLPMLDTIIRFEVDGIGMVAAPLSSFSVSGDTYTLRVKGASLKLDFADMTFKLFKKDAILVGLDNSNGVDVVLSFGTQEMAQNLQLMPAPGRKLIYTP